MEVEENNKGTRSSKYEKKSKKKVVLIISIVLLFLALLLFFLYYFFGGNFLEISKEGNDDVIEVIVFDDSVEVPNVTCKFFGKKVSKNELKMIKNIDVTKLGNQEIEYECKKSFFKKTISIKYNVVDKEAPVMEIDSQDNVSIYVGDEYKEPSVKATDNYDGDITDKIEKSGEVDNKKEGTYEITYSVKDSSSNESSKTIKVEVKSRPVVQSNNSGGGTGRSSNMSCGEAGVIYLTFDDGPNDGHAVGIHTSTHAYNVVYSSDEAFWNDMNIVKERIERLTGVSPTLMRFPGGSSNTVSRHYSAGIMSRLANQIEEKGYGYFDWNISSGDAGGTTDPTQEYYNVVNNLSKSRGNVILMHDIKYHTSQAIDSIVKYGIDNGYTFDVLNTSIICHQAISN